MSHSARFSNRQNQRFDVAPGRAVFDSRSVAVTAVVLAYDGERRLFRALAGERGPAVDQSGLWCLVCGYLDWDERLDDAVRREVFEEAGLDLAALEAAGDATVPSEPIFLQSDPQAHRQNVSARFVIELRRLVEPTTANAEPGEVEQLTWVDVTPQAIAEKQWAFHHDEILAELAAFYESERRSGALDAGSTRRFCRTLIESRYPFS